MFEKDKKEYKVLLEKIIDYSSLYVSRPDFYYELIKLIIEITQCDSVELLIKENNKIARTYVAKKSFYAYNFQIDTINSEQKNTSENKYDNLLLFFKDNPKEKYSNLLSIKSYPNGNLIVMNINNTYFSLFKNSFNINLFDESRRISIILIPLLFGSTEIGLLSLTCSDYEVISIHNLPILNEISTNICTSIIYQRIHSKLEANSKYISFFNKVTLFSCMANSSVDNFLSSLISAIPAAMQYPEITSVRIVLDGRTFTSSYYQNGWQRLLSNIIIKNQKKGFIEIIYTRIKPEYDNGPFLKEEKNLIDTLAKQVAIVIEQIEAEKEKKILQDEIRQADKLNIIGQLAAGIAHELNEPLGSILGFAQLIKKSRILPDDTSKDIDKIIKSSLFARDIIRKLLSFSKELPLQLKEVSINKIVEDGLYFLESRCQKNGIELIRELKENLPVILADETQINQVLINLVVNAIQAMPNGGKLKILTDNSIEYVYLIVEDNGSGMTEDIRKKIFMPFFSTKDLNEGTGLGLTVCHGIISSHNGIINVESALGKGTRFEIKFPIINDMNRNYND